MTPQNVRENGWTSTWLNCYLTELLLAWTFTWVNYDLTELVLELLLYWTVAWLLDGTLTCLNYLLELVHELLLYGTLRVTVMNSYLTERLLAWACLSYNLTELLPDWASIWTVTYWTVTWLNFRVTLLNSSCYFTERILTEVYLTELLLARTITVRDWTSTWTVT